MEKESRPVIKTNAQWHKELEAITDPVLRGQKKELLDNDGISALVRQISENPLHYEETSFVNEIKDGGFEIDFSNVIFNQNFAVTLSDQSIKQCKLDNSTFKEDFTCLQTNNIAVSAVKSTFLRNSTLQNHSRGGKLDFSDARFGKEGNGGFEANFSEVYLNLDCSFTGAKFYAYANFENTVFTSTTYFNDTEFYNLANFSANRGDRKTVTGKISFKNATFLSKGLRSTFLGRVFEAPLTFEGARFELAPEFSDTVLHHSADFRKTTFIDRTYDASSYYRTLKLKMEEARNFPMEGYFHALEEECLRNNKHIGWFEWISSWLYSMSSNYGNSLVRPFLWLVGMQILFFSIYMSFLYGSGICTDLITQSAIVTIDQIFKPVSSLNSFADSTSSGWMLLLKLAAFFHFAVTITFSTLLLFAIRRRFRLRA